MVGVSLRHNGEELLGRVDELDRYRTQGSTLGIPLLHPWANRLAGLGYAAAGREVELDPGSSLLNFDGNGLPIHGVPGANLAWEVLDAGDELIRASLDWAAPELLAVFPFPHRLEATVRLSPEALVIETTLTPSTDAPVPVSFGYHPYLTLPGVPREEWSLVVPPMSRLVLDSHGIPTGEEESFQGLRGPLDRDYDDGFENLPAEPCFAVSGGGRRIEVAFLRGYPFAQVFAPPGKPFVCFEPMTAPTNALVSGNGLTVAPPGSRYEAAFRVSVNASASLV
jgi:galactose mutarotase-like enzyme